MEKSIYMKSEPGGRIGFCELDDDQIILLKDSLKNISENEQFYFRDCFVAKNIKV